MEFCKNVNAYAVAPWFGIGRGFYNTVNVCPNFFAAYQEYRAAVLIHEVSHLCGTKDHEYFSHPSGIKRTPSRYNPNKLKRWVDITHTSAEAFEFWGIKGFCLPEDCSL